MITFQDTALEAPPSLHPQDQTNTPYGMPVLQSPVNREMPKVWHLQIKKVRPILYGWLSLGWLLNPEKFSHPSNQRDAMNTYSSKDHDQHDQNYWGVHQGRPGPLPDVMVVSFHASMQRNITDIHMVRRYIYKTIWLDHPHMPIRW